MSGSPCSESQFGQLGGPLGWIHPPRGMPQHSVRAVRRIDSDGGVFTAGESPLIHLMALAGSRKREQTCVSSCLIRQSRELPDHGLHVLLSTGKRDDGDLIDAGIGQRQDPLSAFFSGPGQRKAVYKRVRYELRVS